jgi:hypothetical protein
MDKFFGPICEKKALRVYDVLTSFIIVGMNKPWIALYI